MQNDWHNIDWFEKYAYQLWWIYTSFVLQISRLACYLLAHILYSNSRYFSCQGKCKLIGSILNTKSIQTERDTLTKSCWAEESTPRAKIAAGQVNTCQKSAISMRPTSDRSNPARKRPACKCLCRCAKHWRFLRRTCLRTVCRLQHLRTWTRCLRSAARQRRHSSTW